MRASSLRKTDTKTSLGPPHQPPVAGDRYRVSRATFAHVVQIFHTKVAGEWECDKLPQVSRQTIRWAHYLVSSLCSECGARPVTIDTGSRACRDRAEAPTLA